MALGLVEGGYRWSIFWRSWGCRWVVFGGFTLHSLHCTFAFAFQGLLECPRRLLQRQFSCIDINITSRSQQSRLGPKNHQKKKMVSSATGLEPVSSNRTPPAVEKPRSPLPIWERAPRTVARSVTGRTPSTTAPDPVPREPNVGGVCGPWTLGYMTAHWRK